MKIAFMVTRPVGISLPNNIIERIDRERGDISRSRYILRKLQANSESKSNKILQQTVGLRAPESAAMLKTTKEGDSYS